ncbi:MAG: hypothetical protein WC794_02730 [Candidatus Doudnabacteria bacterium]|jgi:hypothetical protein
MKKTLFIGLLSLFLAAGCNAKPVVNNQPMGDPSPAVSANQIADKIYETPNLKVEIPAGWTVTEAVKTVYEGSVVKKIANPAAVNIIKGDYILYINTEAGQASGVEGGRFGEIASGAPSAEAVVKEWPGVCGSPQSQPAFLNFKRVDLFSGPKDKTDFCNAPTNNSTAWFFSYITGAKGGYFNYYNADGSEPTGYVITMSYNSNDVNKLPTQGNSELVKVLDEMTAIARTLQIKNK